MKVAAGMPPASAPGGLDNIDPSQLSTEQIQAILTDIGANEGEVGND